MSFTIFDALITLVVVSVVSLIIQSTDDADEMSKQLKLEYFSHNGYSTLNPVEKI